MLQVVDSAIKACLILFLIFDLFKKWSIKIPTRRFYTELGLCVTWTILAMMDYLTNDRLFVVWTDIALAVLALILAAVAHKEIA
jgi:hypothetical protein